MMKNPLYFTGKDGKTYASYVIDLAGRLVFRSSAANSDQPICYALNFPKYQFGQDMPLLWEMTPKDIEDKIHYYSNFSAGIKKSLSKAYPGGKINKVREIFFLPIKNTENTENIKDSDVFKAIDKIESNPTKYGSLIDVLESIGIFQIPILDSYDERYHDIEGGIVTEGFKIIKHGWASSSFIYKKTIITAAPPSS